MSDFGMKDFAYCVFMNSARWRKLLYSWRLNTSACDQAIIGVLASSANQRQNVDVCSKENNRCIWRCRSKINKEAYGDVSKKKKRSVDMYFGNNPPGYVALLIEGKQNANTNWVWPAKICKRHRRAKIRTLFKIFLSLARIYVEIWKK